MPKKPLHKRENGAYSCRMTATTDNTIPGLEFIQTVLQALVDDHDELVVEGRIDDLGVLITVRVSATDMGKLIGKGGQTVKALRTLLRVIGGNTAQRINIKILEPDTPSPTSV